MKGLVKNAERDRDAAKQMYSKANASACALRKNAEPYQACLVEFFTVKKENAGLKQTLKRMELIKSLLYGSTSAIEDLLRPNGGSAESVRQMATYYVIIKKTLTEAKSEVKKALLQVQTINRDNSALRSQLRELKLKLRIGW